MNTCVYLVYNFVIKIRKKHTSDEESKWLIEQNTVFIFFLYLFIYFNQRTPKTAGEHSRQWVLKVSRFWEKAKQVNSTVWTTLCPWAFSWFISIETENPRRKWKWRAFGSLMGLRRRDLTFSNVDLNGLIFWRKDTARSFYDTFPPKIFLVPRFYEQEAEKLSKKWLRN